MNTKYDKIKTSIIIPCYYVNQSFVRMTNTCLKSMAPEVPDEVIVVDDCSPVKGPKFKGTTVIRRHTNGRFPKAVNTGLEAAHGDILIVSNNDIVFFPGWLEGLKKGLEHYDIASIRVTDSDGWEVEDKYTENDYFGSLWAMRRKVYDTIGGLDEDFKLGAFEDKDYYNRAKEAGFTIGKYHGALVDHQGRATNDIVFPNKEDFESSKIVYHKKYGRVD